MRIEPSQAGSSASLVEEMAESILGLQEDLLSISFAHSLSQGTAFTNEFSRRELDIGKIRMWFQWSRLEPSRGMEGMGQSSYPTQKFPAISGDRTHRNNHTDTPSYIHT